MWSSHEPYCRGRAMLDEATLHRVLRRGVREIIVEEEFVRLLQKGKPLRLKMGFDPSRPDIHLGHVVGLRKLSQLQSLGHQVILIVGDWTAQIGDPSGQSATRPMLTHDEVVSNAESFLRQFFKVVDHDRTRVVWQSDWFGKFGLADVIGLASRFTISQFLQREDFSSRLQAGRPIAITELLYPLLQAHDSVAIEADVEFGGTDQKFNLLVGRDLQEKMGQRPQQCFLMPMLVGTDGVRKMSKSLDNYIAVDDPPSKMYGKVMSLPDTLIMDYFEWLTDVPDQELVEMKDAMAHNMGNPMDLKKRLAREITGRFYDAPEAAAAEDYFERVVQRGEVPEDEIQEVLVPMGAECTSTVDLTQIVAREGLVESRSEAHRLIQQGAIEVNGRKIDTHLVTVQDGALIKVGRRRYLKIVDSEKRLG